MRCLRADACACQARDMRCKTSPSLCAHVSKHRVGCAPRLCDHHLPVPALGRMEGAGAAPGPACCWPCHQRMRLFVHGKNLINFLPDPHGQDIKGLVDQLLAQMEVAAEGDIAANLAGRPAVLKLKLLAEVSKLGPTSTVPSLSK